MRCNRCVMDDSVDSNIVFDEHGNCNYCNDAISMKDKLYFPNAEGNKRLREMLSIIKADGKNKRYDCMMGISGGMDSSYLAYLGSEKWKLRILAIHIDDGFDTEISKNNIKKLVDASNIDLITITPDADQYNDLTKAYMRAGVPNLTVPQDSILFASLFKYARENKIKYFLSGGNYAIEYISQIALRNIIYPPEDSTNIRDIHRKFGNLPIDKLNFISPYRVAVDKYLHGIKTYHPLNYIDYNRDTALKELNDFCGFEYYGGKHYENMLTAYMMQIWLPQKFKIDPRTLYLSQMIVSGQITRDAALAELKKPVVEDEILMSKYICHLKTSLNLSDFEYDELLLAPAKQHTDYHTYTLFPLLFKAYTHIVGERPHI